jgi:hypothetical protein
VLSQIVTKIAMVLAMVVGVIFALRLTLAFLTPVIGAKLTASIQAGATQLWDYITPGLTPLLALAILVGIGWLFMGRRRR